MEDRDQYSPSQNCSSVSTDTSMSAMVTEIPICRLPQYHHERSRGVLKIVDNMGMRCCLPCARRGEATAQTLQMLVVHLEASEVYWVGVEVELSS